MYNRYMSKYGYTDTAWGEERDKDSDAFGEVVAKVIYLWKKPGGITHKDNLSGAIQHNDIVTVMDKKQVKGFLYVKVTCRSYDDIQVGWLTESLLFNNGKPPQVRK